MKKEYIMSEEDKELKRMKIEQNRNKRKLKSSNVEKASSSGDEQDHEVMMKKSVRVKEEWSPGSSNAMETQSESSINIDSDEYHHVRELTSASSAKEILAAITRDTNKSSQVIQKVMTTQEEAVDVMSRLFQDPSDALIMISHLIKTPADGMVIISKIMSSPLDALSVFTQFMASPADSLQMIFKIMSSPQDVTQFMVELAKSPNQAMEVMKRFRKNQDEALVGLNEIMKESMLSEANSPADGDMIKTILEVSSIDSSNSSVASPSSAFQQSNSPQVVPSDYSPQSFDTNNNDFQSDTARLLNEICEDISASPFRNSSIDSIITEAIKLEYETPEMARHPLPNRELNEVEIMKIQELIDSNKALYAPVDEDMSSLVFGDCQIKSEPGVDPMLLRVINLTAIAIRRLIKMSKKISGFKKMCQEDQIALLKVIFTSFHVLIKANSLFCLGWMHGNDDNKISYAIRHRTRHLECAAHNGRRQHQS